MKKKMYKQAYRYRYTMRETMEIVGFTILMFVFSILGNI